MIISYIEQDKDAIKKKEAIVLNIDTNRKRNRKIKMEKFIKAYVHFTL